MSHSTNPTPPLIKGNFFFGHLLDAKKEGINFYFKLFKSHGDAMTLKMAHKTFYLFLNPKYYREILVDKPDLFIKGKQYDSLRLVLGNGLLTSEGNDWQKQRRLLNPIFGKEGMDVLQSHIERVTTHFIESKIPLDQEFNWTKLMFDYTLEVAIESFFGKNFDDKSKDLFAEHCAVAIRFISKRMSNPLAPPLYFPTKDNREFKKSLLHIKTLIGNIYDSKKLKIKKGDRPDDLLDLLIEANLDRNEVWDQIISFLIAGHETTALTMSWLFYLLAQNPEYQNKIFDEGIEKNFEFENSLSLSNYPMLNSILNETMRLYPAGWIISRDIAEDTTVGLFEVKKGNAIAISPLITHRDERFWKNANDFIPERFFEGHELLNTAPKNAYLPFSIGRRNCIGARFAILEMNLFCLGFFKKYRVSTSSSNVGMKGFVTLKPDKPIKIKASLF